MIGLDTAKLGATSLVGTVPSTLTGARPSASRRSAFVGSIPVLRALLVAFGIALGLLWVGATVSIVRELLAWWTALEYAGLTATTQWPQW